MSRSGAEEQHVVQLLGAQRPDSSPASRRKLPSDAPGREGSAAAAPKRARRPGALRGICGEMPAKRLPLHGATVFRRGTSEFQGPRGSGRRIPAATPAGDAGKTTPPSSPRHRPTLAEIFAGRANALEGCGAAPVP